MTLDQFVRTQIAVQGLTVKEFAARAGLGLSHVYQILRGQRPNASAETFDAVARGLSMTPAEMAVAMGRGSIDADPDELEILALYRKVAAEHKPAATSMLRGLAVATMHAKSRLTDVAKSRNARLNGQSDQDDPGAHKSLRDCYGLRSLGRGALAVAAL